MAAVDPLFAQWLQAASDNLVRSDAVVVARWGASAVSSERITGIATKAAAIVQGDGELAFLSRGPFGVDVHQLASVDWIAAIGTVVTLFNDDLDYTNGVDVFVLEVEVDRATGISSVTVLRPLRRLS